MSRKNYFKRKTFYRRRGNCYESLAFRIKYAFAISYDDLQVESISEQILGHRGDIPADGGAWHGRDNPWSESSEESCPAVLSLDD